MPPRAVLSEAATAPGRPAVPTLHVDPDRPVAESLAQVVGRWLEMVDRVRPGVLDDVDIECLHEMRTSIRAARSLLRLHSGLVPAAQTGRLAGDLAWLGRLTGPLRDLDVQLLELSGSGDTDVAGLSDLEPVREHLLRQ